MNSKSQHFSPVPPPSPCVPPEVHVLKFGNHCSTHLLLFQNVSKLLCCLHEGEDLTKFIYFYFFLHGYGHFLVNVCTPFTLLVKIYSDTIGFIKMVTYAYSFYKVPIVVSNSLVLFALGIIFRTDN